MHEVWEILLHGQTRTKKHYGNQADDKSDMNKMGYVRTRNINRSAIRGYTLTSL
jgi:hypothetical protein